jgi:hypothetical protein
MDGMGDEVANNSGRNSKSNKYEYRFEVTHPDSSRKQLQLRADSEDQLQQWMSAVSVLINNSNAFTGRRSI